MPNLDVLILRGGTNDLVNYSSEDISSRLHRQALDAGGPNMHTTAITIPELGWQLEDPAIMNQTRALNRSLRDHYINDSRTAVVDVPYQ